MTRAVVAIAEDAWVALEQEVVKFLAHSVFRPLKFDLPIRLYGAIKTLSATPRVARYATMESSVQKGA